MEEQLLLDVFRPHDREVPRLVIEVPKIICEDIPTRSSSPEPQLAEQLVEVPTHPRYASLPSLPCKPLSGGQQRH